MNPPLRLKNPPLVEIWVEFRFLPADPEAAWNAGLAEAFLKTFGDRFKPVEYNLEYGTQIQSVIDQSGRDFRPLESHVSFNSLRAATTDSRQWLAVGKDSLVVSVVKSPNHLPGYTALKEEASQALDSYFTHFQPPHVIQASLHYRDIVQLPTIQGQLRPMEYFSIWIRTPEWVDVPVGRIVFDLSFMPQEDDVLRLRLQSEPSEDEFARFRLDWHLTCRKIQSQDRGIIWGRLDQAHDKLIEHFWRSFTEKGQQLLGRLNP